MSIDWSKAPEGATHFCPARKTWLKQGEHCMWLSWSPFGRINEKVLIGWTFCHPPENEASMITKQWTGEGLPPVGLGTCEYLGARQYDEWTVVNIFAHWNDQTFVDYGDGWRAERDLARFRPIRTPEQIAAEHRAKAIKEMVNGYTDNGVLEPWAAYVYDTLGYRKQVAQ